MQHHDLTDQWTLTATAGPVPPGAHGPVPAAVPGCVHTDLLAAGRIAEPYLDDQESALRWVHDTDWRYSRPLVLAPAGPGERVDLLFEGVDTVGTVRLDGTVLGTTANMHRSYRFDVTAWADGAGHDLAVDLTSATAHAHAAIAALGPLPSAYQGSPFNFVRKMACSFGWDWGPDLRTAGLWRPVRVHRWRTARLARVRPEVGLDGTTGHLQVHVDLERAAGADVDLTLRVRVLDHVAEVAVPAHDLRATAALAVPGAPVWWPAGHGAQPLCDVVVELLRTADAPDAATPASPAAHEAPDAADAPDAPAVLDRWERRVGFRTVHLDLSPDEHGSAFTFVVNGRPVAVNGANWIPDDHFVSRLTPRRLGRRLDQARGAHLNMLRVWGGGLYETDDFYDACDERGILVWQDFLLACAAYPEEEPLRSELEAEARENVVRLMPHPSLVLWNGGNENLWAHEDWGWKDLLGDRTWGRHYALDLLRDVVAELDPTRPYTENSPCTPGLGPDVAHPNDPDRGSHHQWEVWNRLDYTHYRSEVPRFCSEFGFQAPPTRATLARWVHAQDGGALADAPDPCNDPVFLVHQKADDGNGKLDRGMAPHLGVPVRFDDWHWAAQLNQARALTHAVQHYRSWWPRTAGWIVWQLNDCWPVTSWALVDSQERPKPAWYAVRRAAAPRTLAVVERDGRTVVSMVNDTDQVWEGTLAVRRETFAGVVKAEFSVQVAVPARGAGTVEPTGSVLAPDDVRSEVVVACLDDVRCVHVGAEDVDLALDPHAVRATATRVDGGYRVDLEALSFARDVALLVDLVAEDAEVDDMLIDLTAGARASVHVRTGAELDPQLLTRAPVLRSANDLRAVPVRQVDPTAPPTAAHGV